MPKEELLQMLLQKAREQFSSISKEELLQISLQKTREKLSSMPKEELLQILLKRAIEKPSSMPKEEFLPILLQKARKKLSSIPNKDLLQLLLQKTVKETTIFLDIYAVLQVLKSKSQKIILFAGLAHTESLKNILQKLGYCIQYESEIKYKDSNIYSYKGWLNSLNNMNLYAHPIEIDDLRYIS